jgi:hypothetical protein
MPARVPRLAFSTVPAFTEAAEGGASVSLKEDEGAEGPPDPPSHPTEDSVNAASNKATRESFITSSSLRE